MDGLDPTLIERAFRPIDTGENVGTGAQPHNAKGKE